MQAKSLGREKQVGKETWKRYLGAFEYLTLDGENPFYFVLFDHYHNFHVRGLTAGGDCRLHRLQGEYKHSSVRSDLGQDPFVSSFLRFTRNGGFGHGTEFPRDQEAAVST